MRVCQNAHLGFTLKGASEWLRCKALRLRAQGVYLKYMTKPESDSHAADWPLCHTFNPFFCTFQSFASFLRRWADAFSASAQRRICSFCSSNFFSEQGICS